VTGQPDPLSYTCIECRARADHTLKCPSRDAEHGYLHLPPNNDNRGWADEIEGDQA
jgi:hypothetical protein